MHFKIPGKVNKAIIGNKPILSISKSRHSFSLRKPIFYYAMLAVMAMPSASLGQQDGQQRFPRPSSSHVQSNPKIELKDGQVFLNGKSVAPLLFQEDITGRGSGRISESDAISKIQKSFPNVFRSCYVFPKGVLMFVVKEGNLDIRVLMSESMPQTTPNTYFIDENGAVFISKNEILIMSSENGVTLKRSKSFVSPSFNSNNGDGWAVLEDASMPSAIRISTVTGQVLR